MSVYSQEREELIDAGWFEADAIESRTVIPFDWDAWIAKQKGN